MHAVAALHDDTPPEHNDADENPPWENGFEVQNGYAPPHGPHIGITSPSTPTLHCFMPGERAETFNTPLGTLTPGVHVIPPRLHASPQETPSAPSSAYPFTVAYCTPLTLTTPYTGGGDGGDGSIGGGDGGGDDIGGESVRVELSHTLKAPHDVFVPSTNVDPKKHDVHP